MIETEYLGFTIYIGRNANENQTMLEEALDNDYWVHASDYSSAHGIIKNPNNEKIHNKVLKHCCCLVKQYTNKCKSINRVKFDIVMRKHLTLTETPGQVYIEVLKKNIIM